MTDSGSSFRDPHDVVVPKKEDTDEESSVLGSAPVAGTDEAGDVDKIAESAGLYDEKGNPNEPVGIAEQIDKDEKDQAEVPPEGSEADKKEE